MNHVPVVSSNLKSVAYDEASKKLQVAFTNGKTWEYGGVQPHHHQALVGAPSVGKHFSQYIKGKFEGKEI